MQDVPLGFLDRPLTLRGTLGTGGRSVRLDDGDVGRSGLTAALAHLVDPSAEHGFGTAFVDALVRVAGAGAPVGRASRALGHRGWVVSELREPRAPSLPPRATLVVDAPDLDLAIVLDIDPPRQVDARVPGADAAPEPTIQFGDRRASIGSASTPAHGPAATQGAVAAHTHPPIVQTLPERTRILRIALVRVIDERPSVAALADSRASGSSSPASTPSVPTPTVATFDDLFDAASDAVYDAGPVADPAALRTIEHLIEVTSERKALARASRERRALDDLWAAIEPHQDQVLDFLAAASDATRVLRERAERIAVLATQLLQRDAGSATGDAERGVVAATLAHPFAATASAAPLDAPVQARVAIALHDGGAIELRCGWLPHLGTFGHAVVVLRDAGRPETVAPDWGFVPLHLPTDAADALVAERFVDLVLRRIAGGRPT